ncbi:hypothetical protein J2S53_000269 [Actinopolyspora lacussalsi]|nr:hypothetical protein [Actinopolyspora lacussalsi]
MPIGYGPGSESNRARQRADGHGYPGFLRQRLLPVWVLVPERSTGDQSHGEPEERRRADHVE